MVDRIDVLYAFPSISLPLPGTMFLGYVGRSFVIGYVLCIDYRTDVFHAKKVFECPDRVCWSSFRDGRLGPTDPW